MDIDKVKSNVRKAEVIYRQYFEKNNITKADYPYDLFVGLKTQILDHCHSMLDRLEEFLVQDKMYKAYLYLGFIHGCLWSTHCYTLQELKDHNLNGPDDNKEASSKQVLEPLTYEDLTNDWEY